MNGAGGLGGGGVHGDSPGAAFVLTGGEETHQAEQGISGGDEAFEAGFLQAIAGQVITLLFAGEFGKFGFHFSADRGGGSILAAGEWSVAIFALAIMEFGGVVLAQVEHVKHGLLGEKLESAKAFLIVG